MVDVFDEVEEELRRERYQGLLRQWGPWVAGVAGAIVIGVAGYQSWTWFTTQAANEASDAYMAGAALYEQGDLAGADAEFAMLAASGPRGYATLALMRRAAIAVEQGRSDDAARLFEQAAERAPEPLTRQLARYKAALALFDTLSYDDLALRLGPLQEASAPLGPMARELIAAAAMRDERWDEARGQYQLLTVALDAPPGVSRRAGEALAYINQNAPAAALAQPAPVEASEPALIDDASIEPPADTLPQAAEGEDGR